MTYLNQFVRHSHSCLELAILMKMITINPNQKSDSQIGNLGLV